MIKTATAFGLLLLLLTGCSKFDVNFSLPPTIVPVEITIPPDSIKLDPYGFAPLSALVKFSSTIAGNTYISVKRKNVNSTDVNHLFSDMGLNHSIPVIGLYANFLNTVDIRLVNSNGDTVARSTINIQTGPLPGNLPTSIKATVAATGNVEPGLNLVSNYSSENPRIPFMVDNYGDIRWLLNYKSHPDLNRLDYSNGIKRLRNGNFYFGDINTDNLYEVDLLGKILNTWKLGATGYIFHHDIDEMPNGNFIISVDKQGSTHLNGVPTAEDYVIEVDRQTTAIKTVWDLKESLDEYRTTLTSDTNDWVHVNSVLYDSTDNTIIVSGRTQGVFKLTFDNKLKWILAAHKGWTKNRRGENLNQFLLTPLDAGGNPIADTLVLNGTMDHPDFEWSWYQHSTIALPDGGIMLFDNGSSRNYDSTQPKYSRAVAYKINTVNKTIQQTWTYGKDRGDDTFSTIVSSVQYLPQTNHVLFAPGYRVPNTNGVGGKIMEVDMATKAVVSELSIATDNQFGFHRAKRISAYPN